MDHPQSQPRIRRRLGGYRREDVEAHLDELQKRIGWLQSEIEAFRERDFEREVELRRLSAERQEPRSAAPPPEPEVPAAGPEPTSSKHAGQVPRHASPDGPNAIAAVRAIAAAQRLANEVEEEARRLADDIARRALALDGIERLHAPARDRAADIADAARREADASKRQAIEDRDAVRRELEELGRLRAELLGSLHDAVRDVARAVDRIQRGGAPIPEPPPAPPGGGAALVGPDTVAIDVDAGPLDGVLAVARFESALLKLPVVTDAYVRRVSGDRAVVEVTVPVGASLIDAMRESLPYGFEVEAAEFGHIRIALTSGAPVG